MPAKLGPQPEHLKGRKTLILDLDETLIHSTLEYTRSPDFVLPLAIKGVTHLISIHKRPGVENFLERVCQLFEVVIFTASLEEYAQPLVKKIDKKSEITSFLYRKDCTLFNSVLVKDLSQLGRDLKDVILIDNSANSFLFQPQNAYQIKDFFDDKKDQELAKLLPFLEYLAQVDDVRSVSSHYTTFNKLQSSRVGTLTCISDNVSLLKETEANDNGLIGALVLDTKESDRALISNRQRFMRSETETELISPEPETLETTYTNPDEREAWRIVKALSLKQKAMLRNRFKVKEMGPLSIAANPKSSSTSAGSSADRDTDTSPFGHRRLGVDEESSQDEKSSGGKTGKSLFAKKIFDFPPDSGKENYVKFESELEEDKEANTSKGSQVMGV